MHILGDRNVDELVLLALPTQDKDIVFRFIIEYNNSLRILGPPLPLPIVGLFHWVGDVCVSLMLQFCQYFVKAKCVCVCVSYVVIFFGVL